jgi:hypothetical protein
MTDEQILHSIEIIHEMGIEAKYSVIIQETGEHSKALRARLTHLITKGLICSHDGAYYITTDGKNKLDCARERPFFDKNWGDFANEVLTGMDNQGKQSSFVNPVLPKSQGNDSFADHTEDRVIREITRDSVARKLIACHPWLEVDKLIDYWDNNQIVDCETCGELGVHELNKNRANGLAAVCINCQRRHRSK